ncbi:MAG: ATP-binding protein, partial [Nitrospirae bacterium]|nr:ATP-binding protein [Nitrospirota bacterium]
IDESLFDSLDLQKTYGTVLGTLFTTPKGKGWSCVIHLINTHKEKLGLKHIETILPLLNDWNNKNRQGKATKDASLIALFYYNELTKNDNLHYSSKSETKSQIISIILNGSFEIKEELTCIFKEVVSKREVHHRSKYFDLIRTILSSATDSYEIAKNLPDQVIKLADLFWFKPNDKWGLVVNFGFQPNDKLIIVEQAFCLSDDNMQYYPSSPFQTPIFPLLQFAPEQTIDFILSFTNQAIECYLMSKLKDKDEVEKVVVFIDETNSIEQYVSDRLWNMYRGTQISTHLLESIHMALEKWLLETAITETKEYLENLCLYLIKNSKSASITAVVASVVLSQPYKLFNMARVLFQTREIFFYDARRKFYDERLKNSLSTKNSIYKYEDERIKACDDKHRQMFLEGLAYIYQFCGESEEEIQKRQKVIWEIFDEYYKQLPDSSKETESDKTWRFYLARMDRRKMNPTIEEKDGKFFIHFNPEIDPELKKHKEEPLKKIADIMRYVPLRIWSDIRFYRNKESYKYLYRKLNISNTNIDVQEHINSYGKIFNKLSIVFNEISKQYPQHENDLNLVIKETKDIIDRSKNDREKDFVLLNYSTTAYSCAVLLRDYFDRLNDDERIFCKDVVLEHASLPLKNNYEYQPFDGVDAAVNVLPILLKHFAQDRDIIKRILLFILFDSHHIFRNDSLSNYSLEAVLDLWEDSFEDANSIFLGYLRLKSKYNDIMKTTRNYFEPSEYQLIRRLVKEYANEIETIISNNISYEDLPNLNEIDLDILATAFQLLPLKTEIKDHKDFLNRIFPIFSKKLFIDNKKNVPTLEYRFLPKFAHFILISKKEDIKTYLKPFLDDFRLSCNTASFFNEFVEAEDRLNRYEEFWIVWNYFYPKIVEICKDEVSNYYNRDTVHTYLLATCFREDARQWHTLKDREIS